MDFCVTPWKLNKKVSFYENYRDSIWYFVAADTKTKNDLFSCLLCYEKFINAQDGIDHLMSAHGINSNPEQYLENFESPRTHVSLCCKLCKWRMDSSLEKVRSEGRYHIKEHPTYSGSIRDGFSLICMVCQFQIDELSPAAMSSHLRKHGNQVKKNLIIVNNNIRYTWF